MRHLFLLVSVFIVPAGFIAELRAADEVFSGSRIPVKLWNDGEFTEGVAVRSDGRVFFSDIPGDTTKPGQILVFDPATMATQVFSAESRKSNGLAFDSGDRLLACCGANGGNRSLCVVLETGDVVPLIAEFKGRAFNSPNDLVVHPDGPIYFSDPRYVGPEPLTQTAMSVYRFDPETRSLSVATREAKKPNGIEVSPDGTTLYVAETDNGSAGLPGQAPGRKGRMQLLAFNVVKDGSLSNSRVLVDFGAESGIDGMAVDASGRIFAAVRSEARFGIAVYDPSGKELDFVATESLPTNCGFGVGNDASSLYITAGGGLYRLNVSPTSN